MAGVATGRAGRQNLGAGVESMPRLARDGSVVQCSGNLADVLDGNVFIYHIASQAILLSATTGGHPTIFNPLGSNVAFVPISFNVAWTSGTTVIGSILLSQTIKAGSSQATASAILTFTEVDARPALIGTGATNKTRWSPSTNTFTAAPTPILSMINIGPVDPVSGFQGAYYFNDSVALLPGSALSVTYSVTTSTALFHMTIVGKEVPIA